MNVASGFDSAWQFPTRAGLREWKASGGRVVSGYVSYDPSKNWTPARVELVHGLGLGVEVNFEYYAKRALEGHAAGLADGQQAATLLTALERAVGYRPLSRIIIPFSVDFDTTPAQYPAIDAYLNAAQQGLGGLADEGDYGEYDLVMHTAAAGISHMEWQTYAWSGGNFAAGVADFYQWRNDMQIGGAAVDYDQVIDAAKLGAWWPPGHPLNRSAVPIKPRPLPAPAEPAPEDHVILVQVVASTVPAGKSRPGIYTFNGSTLKHVEPTTGGVNNLAGLVQALGRPVPISYAQYVSWGGK